MPKRNIANYLTYNNVLLSHLEIQSSGPALSIYANDPNNPIYTFDPYNRVCNITGKLNVIGEATFDNITVRDVEGGLLNIGHGNPSDNIDLGINASYVDNTSQNRMYTGIIREASDILKRWTFFEYVLVNSTINLPIITEALLASTRMNKVYMNDGTAVVPSIAFDGDYLLDTGLYRIAENSIGVTAGGIVIASISRLSSTASTFVLNLDTQLKFLKINTIDDSVLSNNISTGHIYIKSESASDKWMKFYSNTTAAVPSYAGAVFTSPVNHYFATNVGSALQIFGRLNSGDVETLAPDYRVSNAQLVSISLTYVESKLPVIIPIGTLNNLAVQFNNEGTTGLYRSDTNAIALVCLSTNILNVSAVNVTITRNLYNVNGSVTSPALSFTSSPATGLYSSITDVLNVTTNGINRVTFKASGTDFDTGSIINIGTIGTTSPLNVFGLITGDYGLVISSGLTNIQTLTTAGLVVANAGINVTTGQVLNVGTSNVTSQINVFGLINGNYGIAISFGLTSIQALTTAGLVVANAGINVTTGQVLNVGTGSNTSQLNVFGLINGNNGIVISTGLTNIQALTTAGLIIANAGINVTTGQTLNVGTTGTTSPLNVYGLISGYFGLVISSGLSNIQALTTAGLVTANAGINVTTGQTLNVGTTGTTSPLNVYGLITGTNGLVISSGLSNIQTLTTAGIITANAGITIKTAQTLNVGTAGTTSPLNVYGLITGTNGVVISSGLSNIQALTTAGLIIANAGINVTTGQTLNVGTSNNTSQINVFGLINGNNGIAISSGLTNIQTLTTAGLVVANAGINVTTGQVLNVGTSSNTSQINVFGLINGNNGITISTGLTNIQALTTAGLITANAGVNVTNGQTLNVGTSGTSSVLNTYGTATFTDGTVSLPGITFTNESGLSSGLYRIGTNNIGVSTNGTKRLDISNTLTQVTNDFQSLQGYRKSSVVSSATSITLSTVHNILETTAITAVTITLPSIVGNTGREYIIIRIGAGSGVVTINTNSSTEYIDNFSNKVITLYNQYDRVTLICGSTQWYSV